MPLTKHHASALSIVLALAIISVAAASVQNEGALSIGFYKDVHAVPSAGTALVNLWGVNGSVVNSIGFGSNTYDACVSGSDVFVAYQYFNGANYNLYGQVFNSTGNRTCGDPGTLIADGVGTQGEPVVIGSGSGIIVVYSDSITGNKNIRAQKLYWNGTTQWGPTGVSVMSGGWNAAHVSSCKDYSDGAYIAWTDYRMNPAGDIYAQRINSTGQSQWAVNGVVVCNDTGQQQLPCVAVGDDQSMYVAWEDLRSLGANQIYAQRLNSTGSTKWASNGTLVCGAANSQTKPQIGTYYSMPYVAWLDYRNAGPGVTDIFAQRLNVSNGAGLWGADGRAVCNNTATQEEFRLAVLDSNIYLAWTDSRGGDKDIYAQKINWYSGDSEWALNGTQIFTGPGDQRVPRINIDYGGHLLVAWMDMNSGNADVYAQRIGGNGSLQFPSQGVAVCAEPGDQVVGEVIIDSAETGFYAFWDGPDGAIAGRVHAQHVYANELPTASFSMNPTAPNLNDVITFTDTSTDGDGSIVARSWSFGDGAIATTASTTHAFTAAGSYIVRLTVTDNLGSTSTTSIQVSFPADSGWIVAVVVIGAIGGGIVLLYFLDKNGIINLKPLVGKIRGIFSKRE
jgi:hypothetical protein